MKCPKCAKEMASYFREAPSADGGTYEKEHHHCLECDQEPAMRCYQCGGTLTSYPVVFCSGCVYAGNTVKTNYVEPKDIIAEWRRTNSQIEVLSNKASDLHQQLMDAQKVCEHKWGEVRDIATCCPEPSWARTCSKCNVTKTTTKFKIVEREPIWD